MPTAPFPASDADPSDPAHPHLPDPPLSSPHFSGPDWVETEPLAEGQRWSTFDDIGVLTGPEPWPEWVVTEAAVDTDLGLLKTGKEADVVLVERASEHRAVVLAAKRYRSHDHRMFHRDAGYTEGRTVRRTRDRRAVAKGSRWGRSVEAGQWAVAEFDHLCRCWAAGLPVPYPVQLDGTEILLELITRADGSTAPRLAQTRPDPDLLVRYWAQLTDAMRALAAMGLAHGDLSPYNLLATEERVVLIDLPQAVDIVGNPQGLAFLERDCRNVATWFSARGLPVDGDELLADLLGYAF